MATIAKNYFSRIWKTIHSLIFLIGISIASQAQVTHQVTVQNFSFNPESLVINQGDIVEWVNISGFHNVNGTISSFSDNTNNFGNGPASSPWTYEYTFSNPGVNNYLCDIHPMMQGVITVIGFDCPGLQLNIGDACDDLNTDTENDVVNSDCECVGTIIYDCPDLQLNIGDFCQTGISIDHIAEINENCECEITAIYCETLGVWSGEVCDDADLNTENDVVTLDCECEGALIYCPELEGNAGETCNDGDETTENDMITPDCNCIGTSIFDCPELQLNFGNPCDDENPDTENDVVQEDCTCLGEHIVPENDEPCDAISLSCGQSLNTTSNYATQSMEPINCTGVTPGQVSDVWYGITMDDNLNYFIETTGIDAVIGLYSGGCSTPVYEFCDSQSIQIPAGNTGDFLIRIYDIGDSGNFSIVLSCQTLGIKDIHENARVMQQIGENIQVLRPEEVQLVIVYDLVGKRVQDNRGTQEFPLKESLHTGIYIAVAYNHAGTVIQSLKIFIK